MYKINRMRLVRAICVRLQRSTHKVQLTYRYCTTSVSRWEYKYRNMIQYSKIRTCSRWRTNKVELISNLKCRSGQTHSLWSNALVLRGRMDERLLCTGIHVADSCAFFVLIIYLPIREGQKDRKRVNGDIQFVTWPYIGSLWRLLSTKIDILSLCFNKVIDLTLGRCLCMMSSER